MWLVTLCTVFQADKKLPLQFVFSRIALAELNIDWNHACSFPSLQRKIADWRRQIARIQIFVFSKMIGSRGSKNNYYDFARDSKGGVGEQ